MINALRSTHHPKFPIMPAVLTVIYILGIVTFISLWSGTQYLPGFAGFERYGLVYSILCLFGAVCNIAIMRGQRWGVIGQISIWLATSVINFSLHREIEPSLAIAFLLILLWGADVYRNRQSLK